MSISNAEKAFWIADFKRALNAKALEAVNDSGEKDIVATIQGLAEAETIESLGIAQELQDYEALELKTREAHEVYNTLNNNLDKAKSKLKKTLQPYWSSTEDMYYADPRKMVSNASKKSFSSVARKYANGRESVLRLADLVEALENVERQMMICTTSTALMNFVQKFSKKFGINIEEL